MKKAKTSLSTAAVVGALVVTGLMAAPNANAAPKRLTIAHSKPTWVAGAHSLGSPSSQAKTSVRVYLAPNGGTDALKAAVAKVSDPKSASYRHFLSAKQFHARYDATDATVNNVTSYLRADHLSVTSVEAHHRYIAARGTNANVQKAFGVTLRKFRHRGRTVQANTDGVTIPADIAAAILTVTGLDTTPHLMKHNDAPPPAGFRNARPCSRYFGQVAASRQGDFKTPLPKFQGKTLPYAVCGYTGPQFRAFYGVDKAGLDGSGVKVGIVDAYAAPTIKSDANNYAERNGDGSYNTGQFKQHVPGSFNSEDLCGPSGWYGEETLDVEAVHAMAPSADIEYYASKSCFDDDFTATLAKVVNQNHVSVVTNSWGEPEEVESQDSVKAFEEVFQQAALQGISVMFSSGDDGDQLATTSRRQTGYPTSDPYVTSVGGTADAIGEGGDRLGQAGWGTHTWSLSDDGKSWENGGYLYGAGGGVSSLFNRPAYQNGVVPRSVGAGRAVPDVGLDADPQTGMLIGETQTFPDGVYYDEFRIGGTSLASPLFAGMTALQSQHAGRRLGLQNQAIYDAAGTNAFDDVKANPSLVGQVRVNYNNSVDESDGVSYLVRTFDQDSSLAVTNGWDEVTGVGSPNANWLTSLGK